MVEPLNRKKVENTADDTDRTDQRERSKERRRRRETEFRGQLRSQTELGNEELKFRITPDYTDPL